MRRTATLLGLMILAHTMGASAQQPPEPWQAKKSQFTVWTAAARGSNYTSAELICQDAGQGRPELHLEVFVSGGGPLRVAQEARVTAQGSDITLTLASIGSTSSGNVLRWTGLGRPAFETVRKLATALDESGVLVITGPDGTRATVGEQSMFSSARDVSLRCAPSVVSLRGRIAGARNTDQLITLWQDANSRCRGGSGDDSDVWTSCAERTEISDRLDALNQCYGRQGEAGYQQSWHRCGPRSLR